MDEKREPNHPIRMMTRISVFAYIVANSNQWPSVKQGWLGFGRDTETKAF
jgi:hypothetical protein